MLYLINDFPANSTKPSRGPSAADLLTKILVGVTSSSLYVLYLKQARSMKNLKVVPTL